jgi:hypothetical protein
VYQFSRAIYRELAPYIIPFGSGAGAGSQAGSAKARADSSHLQVLRACEAAIERLTTDRFHFARPARTLFGNIRNHFPMSAQQHVYEVIACYIDLARRYLAEHPVDAHASMNGEPPRCRATTRKGEACQRTPLPHNGYCPSHQHLAETEDREQIAA